jgi:hypothetical protein
VVIIISPQLFLDFLLFLTIHIRIPRLIQWNPAPAPVTTPAMPGDSSWSYNYSPSPSSRYSDRDACRFKARRDETRRELGDVSKKAGITELKWEHQRKQLLETIDSESRDLFFHFNSNSELTAIALLQTAMQNSTG